MVSKLYSYGPVCRHCAEWWGATCVCIPDKQDASIEYAAHKHSCSMLERSKARRSECIAVIASRVTKGNELRRGESTGRLDGVQVLNCDVW